VCCVDKLIKGWQVGIPTMARGEVALLRCAASYTCGEEGEAPAVPPNADVVFEVEMLDFKGEYCILCGIVCYVCCCSVVRLRLSVCLSVCSFLKYIK